MNIKRKAPGIERFTCFEAGDRRLNVVKNKIVTSLSIYEESEEFRNDVNGIRPMTKIFKNFSKQFYPDQALMLDSYECFKYLFLISEARCFNVVLCIKLDFNHTPTLNIYQSLKSEKPFVFEEEKPIFKAFNYEYVYFFNPYELKLEVRQAENLQLPEDLKMMCMPLIDRVTSLVN